AAIAATLSAVFPLFVNLSFTVFSEGPYLTFLLCAVYLALDAFANPSIRNWALAGGAFGCAYLIRQEALAALVFAVITGFLANQSPLFPTPQTPLAPLPSLLILPLP